MKLKISELTGFALDWAVAKCLGRTDLRVDADGEIVGQDEFDYSTDWAQGGPIIEREGIRIAPTITRSAWMAQIRHTKNHPLVAHPVLDGWTNANGITPLIAAMRCYVASKLGNTVDIPDDLAP